MMMTIENTLSASNIVLNFEAATVPVAVEKAVSLLKGESKMLDWNAFSQSVAEREKKTGTSVGGGLMLPHGRGDFVKDLVMSFVRLRSPLSVDGAEVKYLIAVAVPSSMAADYLRLVGALARVFREKKSQAELDSFRTTEEILTYLSERCR